MRASVTFWEATAPVKLPTRCCSRPGSRQRVRSPEHEGWYPKVGSTKADASASQPPTYPGQRIPELQYLAVVKVHGVFPSNHGYSASSPRLQFHRIPRRDSAQVVTPFVQVGTYPTRNFAVSYAEYPTELSGRNHTSFRCDSLHVAMQTGPSHDPMSRASGVWSLRILISSCLGLRRFIVCTISTISIKTRRSSCVDRRPISSTQDANFSKSCCFGCSKRMLAEERDDPLEQILSRR